MLLTHHHFLTNTLFLGNLLRLGVLSILLVGCEQVPIKGTLPTTRDVVHQSEQTESEIGSSSSEVGLWKKLMLSGDTAAAVKNWQEAAKLYRTGLILLKVR